MNNKVSSAHKMKQNVTENFDVHIITTRKFKKSDLKNLPKGS